MDLTESDQIDILFQVERVAASFGKRTGREGEAGEGRSASVFHIE